MLRVLLVDDEQPARQRLRRLLAPFEDDDQIEIVGEAGDGVEALEAVVEQTVDLVFLDIQMPEMSGFDVLDRMPPGHRPAIVFTTAYDQYALKAFEANAVDYLLKPIEEERLAEAIRRVRERRDGGSDVQHRTQERLAELLEYLDHQSMSASSPPASGGDFLEQISVPGKDRLLIIPVEQLLSAEVNDGITQLFTLTQAPGNPSTVTRHIVSYTLDALEQRLDPARFMRVHRSAIVQLSQIREMVSWFSGRYKLILTGGHDVVASRARSKELRDRLSL